MRFGHVSGHAENFYVARFILLIGVRVHGVEECGGVRSGQDCERVEAIGMIGGEFPSDHAAPIMTDEVEFCCAQFVGASQDVADEIGGVVVGGLRRARGWENSRVDRWRRCDIPLRRRGTMMGSHASANSGKPWRKRTRSAVDGPRATALKVREFALMARFCGRSVMALWCFCDDSIDDEKSFLTMAGFAMGWAAYGRRGVSIAGGALSASGDSGS